MAALAVLALAAITALGDADLDVGHART